MNGQYKVAFDYSDLRAVRMARRSLALLAEILEENDGTRGAKIGLALDDLLLLAERVERALDSANDETIVGHALLDPYSRRV